LPFDERIVAHTLIGPKKEVLNQVMKWMIGVEAEQEITDTYRYWFQ